MRPLTLLLGCLLISTPLLAQLPSYVPTDGLVSWYNLDGDAIDEQFLHSGQLVGANDAPNRFDSAGQALTFTDGDYADLGAFTELHNLCEFSASIWYKADQAQGSGCCNILWCSGFDQWLLHVGSWEAKLSFGSGLQCGAEKSDFYSDSLYSRWNHVVTILENGTASIWLNGVLVSSESVTSCVCSHDGSMRLATMDGFPHHFSGSLDEFGVWNRSLSAQEIEFLWLSAPPVDGCMEESACNYNAEANVDDGSCIPSGCMEEGACNYNAAAECEGEACDYSCCPGPGCCGAGTHWDATLATCVVDVPNGVDAACTLMNLQELASGYAALVEQNAALDSLLSACEGEGTANASGPCAGQDHVTYHGYDYDIVEIGDQCWFAENLRADSYADGSALDPTHYAAFDNAPTNIDSYGLLYKGATITDSRNLCPTDWHISTLYDWQLLEDHAAANGHSGAEAAALKSTSGWSTTGNGSDAFGFNATPGGFHYNPIHPYWGEFAHSLTSGYWWTSTPHSAGRSYAWTIQAENLTPDYPLSNGLSVRCVKD